MGQRSFFLDDFSKITRLVDFSEKDNGFGNGLRTSVSDDRAIPPDDTIADDPFNASIRNTQGASAAQ